MVKNGDLLTGRFFMVALIGIKLLELTRGYLIIEVAIGNLFRGETFIYFFGDPPLSYFTKFC
jgi:hypothetical protein